MLRKIGAMALVAAVGLGAATTASAQSPGAWSVSAGNDVVWNGTADLFSSVNLGCRVNATIRTVSPGSGSVADTYPTSNPFSTRVGGPFFSFLCSTVEILPVTPWVTVIGTSLDGGVTWPVEIRNITAKTTTGTTCTGNLSGTFNETTQRLDVAGTLNPGSASCDVDLSLTPTPVLYIAP